MKNKKDAETSVYEDVADTIKNIISSARNVTMFTEIRSLKLKEKYVRKIVIFLHSVKYKKMPSTKTLWEASF